MTSAESEPDVPRDNRSGTVLAQRYRLQRRLSVGGMGEVYEARHTEIPRRFAVKLLRSDFARDPQMRARFRSEAETAASLSSDHIVEVTDFGYAADDSPYLVMELLDGVDLRRLLVQLGRLPLAQAIAVALETCAGLAVAHAQDVVHRDLKPENLFLARRGDRTTLKLLDFGIAKLRNQSLGTAGGRLLGTPAYMPPEQVRGDTGIDRRADIYALGVILYEMLGGRVPHPGTGQHEIITHILFETPMPLRELNPDVPAELAAIVHKALAAAADDRYQSVSELEQALAPFSAEAELPLPVAEDAAGQPTPPARSSEPGGAGSDVAGSLPPTERLAGTGTDRPRSPRLARQLLLVAAALLLLASLVGILQYRGGGTAQPADRPAAVTAGVTVPQRLAASDVHTLEPVSPVSAAVPPTAVEPVSTEVLAAPPARPPQLARERPQPGRRRAAPRPASVRPAQAEPAPPAAGDDGAVIEVRREDAPLVFKRDNPLRR